MKILIDNGHGHNTPGKCSPDGALREWVWTRDCARMLAEKLREYGLEAELLVPEDSDIPLRERVRRANAAGPDCILVSLHNNASGDGSRWGTASGFSAFVAPKAGETARRLAAALTRQAEAHGLTGNRVSPPCGYWTASFAICRDTLCPAVLTENLFMDNRADLARLLSPEGVSTLVDVHVAAILQCPARR